MALFVIKIDNVKLKLYNCNMKEFNIDKNKLITQAEYARSKNITRQRVNQLVKSRELKTVTIKGAVLIVLE